MIIPTPYSRWSSINSKIFRVLDVVEVENNTWVHYIEENVKEPNEYSCYLESFIQRFRKMPDDDTTNRIR